MLVEEDGDGRTNILLRQILSRAVGKEGPHRRVEGTVCDGQGIIDLYHHYTRYTCGVFVSLDSFHGSKL